MPRLKKATLEPFAVDVICPHCGELCENEEGGLMWTVEDLTPGKEVDCSNCPEKFLIPSKVKSIELSE